jgi:hypothetical protein
MKLSAIFDEELDLQHAGLGKKFMRIEDLDKCVENITHLF